MRFLKNLDGLVVIRWRKLVGEQPRASDDASGKVGIWEGPMGMVSLDEFCLLGLRVTGRKRRLG